MERKGKREKKVNPFQSVIQDGDWIYAASVNVLRKTSTTPRSGKGKKKDLETMLCQNSSSLVSLSTFSLLEAIV